MCARVDPCGFVYSYAPPPENRALEGLQKYRSLLSLTMGYEIALCLKRATPHRRTLYGYRPPAPPAEFACFADLAPDCFRDGAPG